MFKYSEKMLNLFVNRSMNTFAKSKGTDKNHYINFLENIDYSDN